MTEPETRLTLEAPGGLVHVTAACEDGKVRSIRVQNLPSFADKLTAPLEVDGIGTLTVDTAFGGDSFVLVDAAALGFTLSPDEARDIAVTGIKVTAAANEQLGFAHPVLRDWMHISFCGVTAPVEVRDGAKYGRNAVAIRPGKIDRSPCGTGCSVFGSRTSKVLPASMVNLPWSAKSEIALSPDSFAATRGQPAGGRTRASASGSSTASVHCMT